VTEPVLEQLVKLFEWAEGWRAMEPLDMEPLDRDDEFLCEVIFEEDLAFYGNALDLDDGELRGLCDLAGMAPPPWLEPS
jgi:hypothetical protein